VFGFYLILPDGSKQQNQIKKACNMTTEENWNKQQELSKRRR